MKYNQIYVLSILFIICYFTNYVKSIHVYLYFTVNFIELTRMQSNESKCVMEGRAWIICHDISNQLPAIIVFSAFLMVSEQILISTLRSFTWIICSFFKPHYIYDQPFVAQFYHHVNVFGIYKIEFFANIFKLQIIEITHLHHGGTNVQYVT